MQKQFMKKQKGMTLVSWIIVLGFIGFQFMLAIKIGPVYAEDHTIRGIWGKMSGDSAVVGKSPKDIKKYIRKKMKMNNIYNFDMKKVQIKKSKGKYLVTLEYEPRGKVVGNLEYIVNFKHEAEIRAR